MLPSVFLSLSGDDAAFVRKVHNALPGGQANFYERSFESGENLIQAMEERIAKSDVFVLFASAASLESTWVRFEIDRARIHGIKNRGIGIYVFPVEIGIPFDSVPDWMKEFWITDAGWKPKDIARFIRRRIVERVRSNLGYIAPQGRGRLLDTIRRKIASVTLEIGESREYLSWQDLMASAAELFWTKLSSRHIPLSQI